jgi:cytochrome c5
MKKMVLVFFAVAFFFGCYYDKRSELFPGYNLSQPCDTASTMSYSQHIAPILSSFCFSCHSGHTPTAGVDLTDYNNVFTYASNGQLVGTVKHLSGFNQMPPTGPIDPCKQRQIELWVQAGAPNN